MIDIKKFLDSEEVLVEHLEKRGYKEPNDAIVVLRKLKKYLNKLEEMETLNSEKNKVSKEIGKKAREKQDISELKEKVVFLNERAKKLSEEVKLLQDQYMEKLVLFPNVLLDDVPVGYSEEENVVIKQNGDIKDFKYPLKPHYDILNSGIDTKRAVKLSGSRFAMYRDKTATLERAISNFMLDKHISNGFEEIVVPTIVKSEVLHGTGHLPKFKEDLYKIENEDKWLIPTAEVPLTNIFSNEVIDAEELPYRFTAKSSSYRSESDSGGKDIKGVIRLHEFRKVEMVSLTSQEEGEQELERLTEFAESILEDLKLPYRRILLCSKEASTASAKTYDLEVWMPGLNKWKEISSISLCTDYQSRNSNIKYKKDGTKKLVYTLNGSGLAVDRCLAAVLENYQTEKGYEVPDVLKKYII